MTSQAQVSANRRNAGRSTGPRTTQGKAAERQGGIGARAFQLTIASVSISVPQGLSASIGVRLWFHLLCVLGALRG